MSAVVTASAQAPVARGASVAGTRAAGSGDAFGQLLKGATESAESADSTGTAAGDKRKPGARDAHRERPSHEAASASAGSTGAPADAAPTRNVPEAVGTWADAAVGAGAQPSTAAVAGQALAVAQLAQPAPVAPQVPAAPAAPAVPAAPAADANGVAATSSTAVAQGSPSLVPATGAFPAVAATMPMGASPASVVAAEAPPASSAVPAAPSQSGGASTSAAAVAIASAGAAAAPATPQRAATAVAETSPAESADADTGPLDALAGRMAPAGAPAGSASGGQNTGQSAKEHGSRVASAASAAPATAAPVLEAPPLASAPAADPAPLASRPEQQGAPVAPASAIAPPTPTVTPLQAVVPASPTTASASAPAAAPANAAPDLPAQLSRPLFTLASAGRGEHVMTVHVTPEALGPVTVRAHVGAAGVHVELFAPTDGGRDALRSILPDLRRDLSGAGLSGSLDLSSQNQPSPNGDERPAWLSGGQRNASGDRSGHAPRASADPDPTQPRPPRLGEPVHTIDLVV